MGLFGEKAPGCPGIGPPGLGCLIGPIGLIPSGNGPLILACISGLICIRCGGPIMGGLGQCCSILPGT